MENRHSLPHICKHPYQIRSDSARQISYLACYQSTPHLTLLTTISWSIITLTVKLKRKQTQAAKNLNTLSVSRTPVER